MTTFTREETCRSSRTDLSVVVGTGGARCRVRSQTTHHPNAAAVRPVLLGAGPTWARVALVAEGALLLAGDQVALCVDVGPGVRLTVVEPSGVVAYAMRGRTASWQVDIRLRTGASLAWEGQPFVVAAEAVVDRSTTVTVADGCRLLLRETLVLGRSGERAGTLRSRTDVRRGSSPVLVEDLALSGRTQVPGLLGAHRVLDSVLALGYRAREPVPGAPGRLDLESGDHLYRDLTGEAHASRVAAVWPLLLEEGGGQSVTEV